MCGIVALYAPHSEVASEKIRDAIASLQHRGPDGQGEWFSPDRRVGLGHARLSIIDLRTGGQPIVSEDGGTVITCNGEFYGYEAIRRELEDAGHRFRTGSDSEVALHLYEDFGPQCLHRLRGEFAFVIWDGVNRTLFAARDRFGIKPLFYAMHDGALYLASEVKALFAAGIPARWDAESFWQAAEQGGHQERTLYDGIRLVPPGHYLIATDQHIQLVRYWDFDYPLAGNGTPRSDADYREELRAALEEAVRIRLRADVPVGCYLSGGLDSCSVLGLAARHHPDSIRAFTLSFDRAEYDEESQAREMAARVGAEFHPIAIRQDDLADAFADAVHQSEALCLNAHSVAKYLLSRAVRKAGYKVVMTGEGSDEIFGGYVHFRRDMLLYNSAGLDLETTQALWAEQERVNKVSQGLLMSDGSATGPLDDVKRMLGFVPSWMETFSSRAKKLREVLTDDYLAMIGERQGYRALLSEIDIPGQLAGREPVHQSLYLWSKTCLPTYILTMLGDRMEMGHSIEGRVPFLDHHLVEVIRSQPVNQKIRGMTEKYVLREAVQDVITDTVYRRQKHPFLAPPSSLNPQGKLYALVQDTLRGSHLASIPFFDQKKIISMLDRIDEMDDAGRIANDATLMFVTSACVLQERFRLAA